MTSALPSFSTQAGKQLRLSQIRPQIQKMEADMEAGTQPSVNPYPDSWSPEDTRAANSRILSMMDPKSKASFSEDMTLGQVAERKSKYSKIRDVAKIAAGALSVGALAAMGGVLLAGAGIGTFLAGAAMVQGSVYLGEVYDGFGRADQVAGDVLHWAGTAKPDSDSTSKSPAVFTAQTAQAQGQAWNLSPTG